MGIAPGNSVRPGLAATARAQSLAFSATRQVPVGGSGGGGGGVSAYDEREI